MVYVVDAMMGAGKSSAAIQYMNDHAYDKRFLYITPYIDETQRICDACPDLNFALPHKGIREFGFTKSNHLKALIEEGRNVAMSHILYSLAGDEVIQLIIDSGYTIIIDEVMDVFTQYQVSKHDMQIIKDSGWLVGVSAGENADFEYFEQAPGKEYECGKFAELFLLARSHRLINMVDDHTPNKTFFYWTMYKDPFLASPEIYILTYLFDGSPMKAFLEINGIEYTQIGVGRDENGAYRFCERSELPEIAGRLKSMIHILDDERLNAVGKHQNALSASWYKDAKSHRGDGRIDRVRKNLITYFKTRCRDIPTSERMWCVFDNCVTAVRDKGFYTSNVSVSSRATNKYRTRRALGYCVNIFANPMMVNHFRRHGADIDENKYALAFMVQWIFRSAIRDGKDIWLYIPSSRMRRLLMDWLDELEAAGHNTQEGGETA